MSADSLTVTSRAFFERTKAKLAFSIFIAASGLMLLGFCSASGGLSASNNNILQGTINDDNTKKSLQAMAGGYGFACFVYLIAFILLISAAIYMSPIVCGSNNERKMIRSPQEIDASYAAYSENTSADAAPKV
eukprot:gene9900-13320_t